MLDIYGYNVPGAQLHHQGGALRRSGPSNNYCNNMKPTKSGSKEVKGDGWALDGTREERHGSLCALEPLESVEAPVHQVELLDEHEHARGIVRGRGSGHAGAGPARGAQRLKLPAELTSKRGGAAAVMLVARAVHGVCAPRGHTHNEHVIAVVVLTLHG